MKTNSNRIITAKCLLTTVLISLILLSSSIVVLGNKIPVVKAQSNQTASPQTNMTSSPSRSSLNATFTTVQPTGPSSFANLSAAATTALVPGETGEGAPLLPPVAQAQVDAQKNELQSNQPSASTASILEEKNQTVVPVDIQSALATANATTNSTASPTTISPVAPSANMSSTNSTTSGSAAPSAVGNVSSATAPESAAPTPQVVNTGVRWDGPDQARCGGFFPPDATIASGRAHVVMMDNLCGAIHLKNGVLLRSFALNPFFRAGTDRTSDPFVSYDIPTGRFFATLMDITRGGVFIAVSKPLPAGGPLAPWATFFLSFKSSPTATDCLDQPFHATSLDKLVVSGNTFGNHCAKLPSGAPPPYLGARTAIINKACLFGIGPCRVQANSWGVNAFSLHPVLLFGTNQRIILVSDGFGLNQHFIRMQTCSGGFPCIWQIQFVPIHTTLLPPGAIQKGIAARVNTNDGRTTSAHETSNHNFVWLTFNDGCKPGGDPLTRSCTRLIEINRALGIPTAAQDFDIGFRNFYLFYGALTVVPVGNLDVVFGASGVTLFPSLFATRQVPGAPINHVDAPILLKLGLTFSSHNPPRYGDYFGASPDPSDLISAWLYGEYMKSPNNWGTWVNKVF